MAPTPSGYVFGGRPGRVGRREGGWPAGWEAGSGRKRQPGGRAPQPPGTGCRAERRVPRSAAGLGVPLPACPRPAPSGVQLADGGKLG